MPGPALCEPSVAVMIAPSGNHRKNSRAPAGKENQRGRLKLSGTTTATAIYRSTARAIARSGSFAGSQRTPRIEYRGVYYSPVAGPDIRHRGAAVPRPGDADFAGADCLDGRLTAHGGQSPRPGAVAGPCGGRRWRHEQVRVSRAGLRGPARSTAGPGLGPVGGCPGANHQGGQIRGGSRDRTYPGHDAVLR